SNAANMATAVAAARGRIVEGLAESQRAAVRHGDGPLLIVAGAGTGKTTVLTRRIAHLIASKRARPEQILALTFTEKAAVEMAERVDQLIPYGYAETWIGTFHAFGDRILRESALEVGLGPEFRVLTRPEQIIFLRERLWRLPLDRFRPLRERPAVLAALRARYRYILVDEFQDTNRAQLEMVRLLAGPDEPNVTVVGDDDQAIYRWRGAAAGNLIAFRNLYPGAREVVLTD